MIADQYFDSRNQMIAEAKYQVQLWGSQMKQLMGNSFNELDPQMYCIGAVFVICIGFVLLAGRR